MGLFDRLKNAAGAKNPAPPERHANPTEAEQDSMMNARLTNVTTRWNRGSLAKPDTAGPEQSSQWQQVQKQIDEKRQQVKGARILKRLRGGM